ncbi:nitroreductase family protein [Thermococcus argininiproducens]|uniref:Nitroreductase family protein n=1 Tax=Thermococcus argininiproducens TaxID=2866384 RepID=A0A9E7MBS9_9EURY|nr:nitroreductase family protein [Thermococcus argininiproducens]USH00754.1 nitroreductase family protein [Thermococcus argininiproducens]
MELKEAISKRVSIRYYDNREVEEEKIKSLIEAAIRAPTASALENWLFVIYKSEQARKRIHEIMFESHIEYYQAQGLPEEKLEKLKSKILENGMYKAPMYIGVFIDKRIGILKDSRYSQLEFIWAIESAAGAIENLMLKAVELGLGTCYIGVTSFDKYQKELREMAGLEDNWYLVGLIPVGYPSEKIAPRRRRKSLDAIMRVV